MFTWLKNLICPAPVTYDDMIVAVATRFEQIRPNLVERESDYRTCNEYCYDGRRTDPMQLGWRFHQNLSINTKGLCGDRVEITRKLVRGILRGDYDELIESTWHDAAGAEHWYRYEKQWD